MTVIQQGRQRALHGLHRLDTLRQFINMSLGNALDAGAGALAVMPQADQLGDFGHGETEVAPTLDELQAAHIGLGVLAVAAVGARHPGQQTERFIVAHHLGRHGGEARRLSDGDRPLHVGQRWRDDLHAATA